MIADVVFWLVWWWVGWLVCFLLLPFKTFSKHVLLGAWAEWVTLPPPAHPSPAGSGIQKHVFLLERRNIATWHRPAQSESPSLITIKKYAISNIMLSGQGEAVHLNKTPHLTLVTASSYVLIWFCCYSGPFVDESCFKRSVRV